MSSSLLVYRNTGSMLSSRMPHFDFKMKMEQTVVRVTQEVVRGMVGLDAPGCHRQFDPAYQTVLTVYKKYKTELDQLVRMVTVTDMETTVRSFAGVLDKLLIDGHLNYGRVVIVLVFAGCLTDHCIKKEIIASDDVDQLAEVMGRHLATRLINSQLGLEEFERFCSQSSFFERLPWRSIALTVFSLGAIAVLFSIR